MKNFPHKNTWRSNQISRWTTENYFLVFISLIIISRCSSRWNFKRKRKLVINWVYHILFRISVNWNKLEHWIDYSILWPSVSAEIFRLTIFNNNCYIWTEKLNTILSVSLWKMILYNLFCSSQSIVIVAWKHRTTAINGWLSWRWKLWKTLAVNTL